LVYEAVLLAALLLGGSLGFVAWEWHVEPVLARPALQILLLVLAGTYFVWQWSHGGQTLPMRTWRLRLITVDGKPLTVRQATGRYVLAITGVLLCGIGVFWAFFDRDRQFLHDRLAGTKIVMSDE
jgi:uncharacterized RDD family membrane protein YckC